MDKHVLKRLLDLSYGPCGGNAGGKPHTSIELEALRQRGLARVDIRGIWDITDKGRQAIDRAVDLVATV